MFIVNLELDDVFLGQVFILEYLSFVGTQEELQVVFKWYTVRQILLFLLPMTWLCSSQFTYPETHICIIICYSLGVLRISRYLRNR